MSSPARAAANAANGSLSTGPRTKEGKARSSRNAVKHGLTSKQVVIAPGEEDQFAELHDSLHEQLLPAGALEMGLFNMLVHAAWNIERFRALEAQLMANGIESLLDERTAQTLDRLQRYTSANQRSYFKALKELRIVQENRLHRRELQGHDDPLPELVSVGEVVQRIRERNVEADQAQWRAMEAYINAPIPRRVQNEPTAGPFEAGAC